MKNHKIIASWNKIEPGDSANERMLSAILERNRSVQNGKGKVRSKAKKRLIPAVVCLAVLIAVTVIAGGSLGWFGSKDYTVKLANGDTVEYHSGTSGEASFAAPYPVTTRDLTDTELDNLFPAGTGSRSAVGTFRDETGALLRVEGKIGNSKLIYARDGFPVNDVVIAGDSTVSSVAGVPVSAGYFITRPNSAGKQLAIFFGSFQTGSTRVYVECSGDRSKADEVSRSAADLILRIVERGEPDLSAVTK